jgi:IclR family transcriptional regulator, pca regulon regulatory protein
MLDDDENGDNVRSRDFVQSLERGLAIIRVFNAERPSMSVSEIAHELGLTRAAVRRFLLTLGELGYVYGKNNRFELTPRVLELGYAYLSALSFPDIALPRLEQLVAETGEASEGSILHGGDVVYVVRVPGPALMTISVNITDVDALRAELNRVREDGYALVDQELEEGLVAIAVPVRDRTGRVRAAINLSTHIGRKSVKEMRALVPAVRAAAADIEVGLKNSLSWRE